MIIASRPGPCDECGKPLRVGDIHWCHNDPPMMTGREMCEYIADAAAERNGGDRPDPERIWNMSPSGELWPVFEMFYAAWDWKHTELRPTERKL